MKSAISEPVAQEVGGEGLSLSESEAARLATKLGIPAALVEARGDALRRLNTIGLPLGTAERWRYTSPDRFDFPRLLRAQPGTTRVVGGEQQGVVVRHGAEITTDQRPVIDRLLRSSTAPFDDGVSALQLLCLSSVTLIEIAPRQRVSQPIELHYSGSEVQTPLVMVLVGEGAHVALREYYPNDVRELTFAPRLEALLERNSSCSLFAPQTLKRDAVFLARQRFHAFQSAKAELVHILTGGKTARLDLAFHMLERDISVDLLAGYRADGDQTIALYPGQLHHAPHCRSDLYAKGIIKDRANTVYCGAIAVDEGAQKTDAYQRNRNLLLSKEARADSIPNLEIKANDVRCTHGASVTQFGEEEIFYLRSRGLTPRDAERLLTEAFYEDLLGRISSESIREESRSILLDGLSR